jgi:AcrR family transcriptional regulator
MLEVTNELVKGYDQVMITSRGEATKARILEAALQEFAEHGLAGARVDRIAAAAGYNKNLIYVHYGNKETLFTAVIEHNTAQIVEALPFTPDDLPGYAARAFDYAMANPASMRLVAWFALEQGLKNPASRAEVIAEQRRLIGIAQERGTVTSAFPPGFLMTALMLLAGGWSAGTPFGPAMDPEATEDPDHLRELIAAAIARLCGPEAIGT